MRALEKPHTVHPPAEIVAIGNNFCIFRPDNHALAMVDARAADIFKSALGGDDMSDLARRISRRDGLAPDDVQGLIETVLSGLRSEGFLDQDAGDRGRTIYPDKYCAAGEELAGGIYQLAGGPCVRLACDDGRLTPLLKAALHPLAAPCGRAADLEIVISKQGTTYQVRQDGEMIAWGLDLAMARRAGLQTTMTALLPPERVAAVLHASTASIDGRAVILAGATGSGKTTLMMALVASGAGYMADDMTPLDRSGRIVSRFPLAASIKSGSWNILAPLFPDLDLCESHSVGDRTVRYFDPEGVGSDRDDGPEKDSTQKCGILIFPKFEPGSEVCAERLTPEEAMARLFDTGSEVAGAQPSINPLARLVNHTPAWSIVFSDPGDCRAEILAALAAA